MDNPKPLGKFETGSKVALPIFEDFVKKAIKKSDARPFKVSEGITMMVIDPLTGQKAKFTSKNTIIEVFKKKNVFALTVNGDSMIDACIADGDMVLMEPIKDSFSLRNGTIVSALVPGLGTTLKYFVKRGGKIFLEAANPAYEPIELNLDEVVFQGKLLAVWRKV